MAEVSDFARLARQNLALANSLLAAVREPIAVNKDVIAGSVPPLDTFAVAVAAAITLLFVTVLLVSGSLALEREENTFTRLTRGLVSRTGLLVEKATLGTGAALAVTLLMLAAITPFESISWSRIYLIVPAILLAGAASSALGLAIGAAAKEVRASALLAFALALPVAFISLVPSGTVSKGLLDVIHVIAGAFPVPPCGGRPLWSPIGLRPEPGRAAAPSGPADIGLSRASAAGIAAVRIADASGPPRRLDLTHRRIV